MSLSMSGHIDDTFRSLSASRIAKSGGGYVNGFPVQGSEQKIPHIVNVQTVTDREIQHLDIGGRRISDVRKIYVNDGVLAEINEADDWEFDANGRGQERYETLSMDSRPWRDYCRVIVVLRDER